METTPIFGRIPWGFNRFLKYSAKIKIGFLRFAPIFRRRSRRSRRGRVTLAGARLSTFSAELGKNGEFPTISFKGNGKKGFTFCGKYSII